MVCLAGFFLSGTRPSMDRAEFWKHVTSFNTKDPDESRRGWLGLQRQIRKVVHARFPAVLEFDWESIEMYALEKSLEHFDPNRGALNTCMCWWAQSGAWKSVKKAVNRPKTLVFSQFEHEDSAKELVIPICDFVSETLPSDVGIIELVLRTDIGVIDNSKSKKNLGMTVCEYLLCLLDGQHPDEIAKRLGISHTTIYRISDRIRSRLEGFGMKDVLMSRIANRDQSSRSPQI
jgi:hypothetical protein